MCRVVIEPNMLPNAIFALKSISNHVQGFQLHVLVVLSMHPHVGAMLGACRCMLSKLNNDVTDFI